MHGFMAVIMDLWLGCCLMCDNDPYSTDSFLCLCHNCGFIFIPTRLIRCPFCNNGNIGNVPIKNHAQFTLSWLSW